MTTPFTSADEANDSLLERLERALIAGRLDRRGFMRAAAATGFSTLGLSAIADELRLRRGWHRHGCLRISGAFGNA
jgi:choline dehydrogenase